jgi:uncharacterized protein (TIRG00374 family)
VRKFLVFLISLVVGIILFSWVLKFVGWPEIKNAFLVFTGWRGMMIFFLTILIFSVGAWKWREILKSQGNLIPFSQLFKAYLAGFSLMYLFQIFSLGGEFLRGYVLKKENSLPLSKGLASVIIDRILDWTMALFIIFFGILIFVFRIGLPPKNLTTILAGTFLAFLIGIPFFYYKVLKRESLLKFFLKFFRAKYKKDISPFPVEEEIFNFFKIKEKSFWKSFGLSFLKEGMLFLRSWLLIFFLGKNIGFLAAFSVLGFYTLATALPIPAELGNAEVVQLFVFNSFGLTGGMATAFVMVIRGADLILALIGLFLFFRLGFKLTEENLFKNKF